MRIPLNTMKNELESILLRVGLEKKRAALCASIFTENSLVGVAHRMVLIVFRSL